MKKNILSKAVMLLFLFTAFGCRVRKPIAPVVVNPSAQSETKPAVNKSEVLQQINSKQLNFNTLSIKAKADLSINNNNHDVNMNIRMQKNKVIWVSVSMPIIGEVARTLITPDSIKILNKFQSIYIRKPFSYIHEYANKAVDFNTLQNFFIGNAGTGTLTESSEITINGGQTQLKGDLSGLIYLLIFNENRNLIQNNLNDSTAKQTLIVNYGEHQNVSGQDIPAAVSIKSTAASKSISVDLRYSQVGINDGVDFPFSVPGRYTIKD